MFACPKWDVAGATPENETSSVRKRHHDIFKVAGPGSLVVHRRQSTGSWISNGYRSVETQLGLGSSESWPPGWVLDQHGLNLLMPELFAFAIGDRDVKDIAISTCRDWNRK